MAMIQPIQAAAATASTEQLELTVADGPLTAEQRQAYERDGYLICRSFFPRAAMAPLHEHYLEICRDPLTKVKGPDARVSSLVRDINVVDGSHDLGDLGLEYGVIKMNGFVG